MYNGKKGGYYILEKYYDFGNGLVYKRCMTDHAEGRWKRHIKWTGTKGQIIR